MSDQTLTPISSIEQEALEAALANAVSAFRKALSTAANNMLLSARRKLNLGITPEMEQVVSANEKARTEAYLARMTQRLEVELDRAVMSADPTPIRLEAWHKAIERETTYVTAHIDAAEKRLERAAELTDTFKASPQGAIWKLGVAKQHTPDCLAMGNKAWSWPVLLSVNPYNRHYGCKCHIEPLPEDFDLSQINTALPVAVTMDAQEVSTYRAAKKAFNAAKQGSRRAEYVAMSQLEKAQRTARQDAQLGGHFISRGGKAIFIPKVKAKSTRIGPGLQASRFKTDAKPSRAGGTSRPTPSPKAGKTAVKSVKTAPDSADITLQEADGLLKQSDYEVFSSTDFRHIYDADINMPDGRVAKFRLHAFDDNTKKEAGRSNNPFDATGHGVILIDGKAYGTFTRSIYVDKNNEWIAHHDYMAFEHAGDQEGRLQEGGEKFDWASPEEIKALQGQGIATRFNQRAETFYRVIGVDRVTLFANKDVGGYAWAKSGYDYDTGFASEWIVNEVFKPQEPDSAKHRLARFDSKFQINKYVKGREKTAYMELAYKAVTPFELSQVGREGTHWEYEGHDMWFGKALLMGSGWGASKRIRPLTDDELKVIEATADSELSDFARELIIHSNGRSDMDEYQLSRIIAEVHNAWTLALDRVQGRKHSSFPAYASAENSVFNQHNLDMLATPEEDNLFYDAVNKAIRDFDALLKASVPAES